MIALLAAAFLSGGVYEAHDRFPGSTRDCDTCACMSPDGDHDCDDVHGVPVNGGWAPTVVLALAAAYVFTRKRKQP